MKAIEITKHGDPEVLELKAPVEGRPIGSVIESGIESGKGAVATILMQEGKLNKGDFIKLKKQFLFIVITFNT